MSPSLLKMALSSVEKPLLFILQKGREYYIKYTSSIKNHQSPVACTWMHLLAWYIQSHWRSFHQCETCTWFQAQNDAAPLTSTPTPFHPWQMCNMDIFILEGFDCLICGDFYSKMILVQCLPSGQSNTTKVILLLKEMFSEHGIPDVLCSDNGPQYVSAQFAEFCTSWGITHETLSPHYPQLNGLTKACVKSVKHALQCAKYSSADLQLVLLVLLATPINAKLPSPAELLYQHQLRTTIPAKICNTDPAALQVHEQIGACSEAFKSQVDKHCKSLKPLYAHQPAVMYDTLHKIWIPATVVHMLPKDSYQVCTSDGTAYCHMRWHLHKCSVKPIDNVPDTIRAIPQAPVRPHISEQGLHLSSLHNQHNLCLLHPQCLQLPRHRPQLFPPHQLSQRSPLHLHLQHLAEPLQPRRSGHACIAPKCLIQEM